MTGLLTSAVEANRWMNLPMCVLTLGCHCGTLVSCCRVEAMPEAASRSELYKDTTKGSLQYLQGGTYNIYNIAMVAYNFTP